MRCQACKKELDLIKVLEQWDLEFGDMDTGNIKSKIELICVHCNNNTLNVWLEPLPTDSTDDQLADKKIPVV